MSARGVKDMDQVVSQGSTCNGGCKGCPHPWTGQIETGIQFINSSLAARVTDQGTIFCPHNGRFMITKGSDDVIINQQKAARIGDEVVCIKCGGKGLVVGSSSDTFTNNR